MKATNSIHPPIFLKAILDIFFWITLFGLLVNVIFTAMYLLFDISAPLTLIIMETEVTKITTPVLIGIVLKLAISAVFIYIIYLLRKVVRSFFKRKIFTQLQISGLNLVGQLIILTAIAEVAVNFALRLFLERKAQLEFTVNSSFNSLWFILAIGLFFILLSKSFKYAKGLQEESDFTI